jgi:hypothetical protein
MKAWFDWLDTGIRRYDGACVRLLVMPAHAGIQSNQPSICFSGA